MRSLILSQWRERRMGVIWQDLGALTTVRAREFWICWRRDNWDLGNHSYLRILTDEAITQRQTLLIRQRLLPCGLCLCIIGSCYIIQLLSLAGFIAKLLCVPSQSVTVMARSSPVWAFFRRKWRWCKLLRFALRQRLFLAAKPSRPTVCRLCWITFKENIRQSVVRWRSRRREKLKKNRTITKSQSRPCRRWKDVWRKHSYSIPNMTGDREITDTVRTIGRMITFDLRPLNIVEDVGFRQVIKVLD